MTRSRLSDFRFSQINQIDGKKVSPFPCSYSFNKSLFWGRNFMKCFMDCIDDELIIMK